MLTSKKTINHNLIIRVSEEYLYLVKIIVFNSNNKIIESQTSNQHETSFSLPQGLYNLRIEMNGGIKDEVILLDNDKEFLVADRSNNNIGIITPPKQFSSALLGDTYGSSHEYYTYPAIDCSKKDTFYSPHNDNNNLPNSSLFIFLRFSSRDKYVSIKKSFTKPFYYDFEIVNEEGNILTAFEAKNGIDVNEQDGWASFNATLTNGIYYLIYRGKEQRQIPVYVFKDWHTQLFMTLGNEPLFGTTRIFLSRQREFNPNERTYKYIDILLDKLQNEDYSLDRDLINKAAIGKYDSPMLGLICSYIYLKSKNTKNDELFKDITQNMQEVILKDNEDSPDLRALDILASNHFPNYTYKKTSVQGTPMFRIGFETILKASVENKRLISQNSINDFISENLFFDSPFNTFKPVPFRKKSKRKQISLEERYISNIPKYIKNEDKQFKIIDFNNRKYLSNNLTSKTDKYSDNIKNIFNDNDEIFPSKNLISKIDKYSTNIKNLFDNNVFNFIQSKKDSDMGNSWIKSSIVDIIKTNKDISINDISKDLGISGKTVNRIFTEWKKEVKNFGK